MNKKIIIFDLDGTLADIRHRRHFVEVKDYHDEIKPKGWKPDWDAFHKACVEDVPNEKIISLYQVLRFNEQFRRSSVPAYSGIPVDNFEIWSGRDESVRKKTAIWLNKYGVIYDKLRMRPHGDHCPDVELKKRWLDEVGKENVLMVFDDRDRLVKMWRDEGITCLQVAEGNF